MLSRQRFNSCCGCFFGRLFQPAAVFVGAEAGELFEGAGKVAAVGIADEVDDIADLQAGVGQQREAAGRIYCVYAGSSGRRVQ